MIIEKLVNISLMVTCEETFFEGGLVERGLKAAVEHKIAAHIHPGISIKNVDAIIDWES